MSANERSGWRDQELSRRHRRWGFNCPAVDLDFLMVEYHLGVPVAIVDYKHWRHHEGDDINIDHPNYVAAGNLYSPSGEQLPLFVARYWPEVWAIRALAVNDAAKRWLGEGAWRSMTERQWVTGLHKLRQLTVAEVVLRNLRDEMPPSEARAS